MGDPSLLALPLVEGQLYLLGPVRALPHDHLDGVADARPRSVGR